MSFQIWNKSMLCLGMCFSQCASETLLFWSSVQKKSRFTSNLDSPRYKRDECGERKRNGKKCKHRKVLLKTQLGVRNVNREVFKVGNNCFKLSIIGLYLMSWTRARTNTAILGAARSTEKTTGLIVDKLLRLGFNIILDVGRSFKNIFFYKEKRIKSLLVKVFEKKTFLTAETHNVKPLLSSFHLIQLP